MSKARRFFIDYLMVPVLIPVFSAAAAVYYVNQETEDYCPMPGHGRTRTSTPAN